MIGHFYQLSFICAVEEEVWYTQSQRADNPQIVSVWLRNASNV
jgi:hypothetical protein